ncbi:hypothetical protein CMK19_12345 [Candidatus Poribacteria bacterium]|nr:hypothetical protein [Candidatus Poribacteria bacterium]
MQFVKTGLESVGRTTLTCYLIQSILSTFVFSTDLAWAYMDTLTSLSRY